MYTDCFAALAKTGKISGFYPSDAPKDCLKSGKVLGRTDGVQSKKAKVKKYKESFRDGRCFFIESFVSISYCS